MFPPTVETVGFHTTIYMKLEPNKTYKVTKGNTDRSILIGDLIYLDGKSGMLIVSKAKGWLERDELTPSAMDFECVPI